MKTVSCYNITDKQHKQMESLIKDGFYPSKSHIVRYALNRFLMLNSKLSGDI